MPKYTFHCQTCSPTVRFTRNLKIGDWPTHPCPACREEAPRLYEGFGFQFQAGRGSEDANTGVHAHDYPTADQAVGRSAEDRWHLYREREKIKRQARALGGTGALARVDGEGYTEYAPLTPAGQQARASLVNRVLPAVQATAEQAKVREKAEWAKVRHQYKPDR